MTDFGVIGAGPMGRAVAERLARAGMSVTIADRHEDRARSAAQRADRLGLVARPVEQALEADVLVLAIWYPDTIAFASRWAEHLADKVVVDLANPLDDSYTHLTVPGGESAAEHLARRLPRARVVKAFNTVTATSLALGGVDRTPLDVFVAGDEDSSKALVLDAVHRAGLRGVDAGALENAGLLERLAAFGIELGQRYGFGFGSGFKFLPETPYLIALDAPQRSTASTP